MSLNFKEPFLREAFTLDGSVLNITKKKTLYYAITKSSTNQMPQRFNYFPLRCNLETNYALSKKLLIKTEILIYEII